MQTIVSFHLPHPRYGAQVQNRDSTACNIEKHKNTAKHKNTFNRLQLAVFEVEQLRVLTGEAQIILF